VHSAKALPYIRTLTENLHYYFDTLVLPILTLARVEKSGEDIGVALKLMSSHEKLYLSELKKNKLECNNSNYKYIIFGSKNPISPYAV
jgi:hypothetical protein